MNETITIAESSAPSSVGNSGPDSNTYYTPSGDDSIPQMGGSDPRPRSNADQDIYGDFTGEEDTEDPAGKYKQERSALEKSHEDKMRKQSEKDLQNREERMKNLYEDEAAADTEPVDMAEYEVPSDFVQMLYDGMGWEFDPNVDRFESPEALVQFVRDAVEENQQHAFVNDEIRELNEFVRKGGTVEEYYQAIREVDINDIPSDELIRTYMENQGFDPQDIEDEINERNALGTLDSHANRIRKQLRQNQEVYKQQFFEQQKANEEAAAREAEESRNQLINHFYESKDIFGRKVDLHTADKMLDVMFEPDNQGLTRMQALLNDPDKVAKIAYLEANNWDFAKLVKFGTADIKKQMVDNLQVATKKTRPANYFNPNDNAPEGEADFDWINPSSKQYEARQSQKAPKSKN